MKNYKLILLLVLLFHPVQKNFWNMSQKVLYLAKALPLPIMRKLW